MGTPVTARSFVWRSALFLAIGLCLYAGLYAGNERIIDRYAQRNRFYRIHATPPTKYDYVILGASHAAVFDYRDMNAQLERMTGSKIMNLAVVGGGVAVNRLLLDYFLTRHRTDAVVYVLDSFAFYSPEWNENRLQDVRLFLRAPFDPSLVRLLAGTSATRWTALDYATGFSKINNRDRFASDLFADEGAAFDRTYRPVRQIDSTRMAYLYPKTIDPATFQRYMAEFEALIGEIQSSGARMIVIRPPIPERVRRAIPDEDRFDAALKTVLDRHAVEYHDFSQTGNDEKLFQDTDHLNKAGALQFFETSLAPLLTRTANAN